MNGFLVVSLESGLLLCSRSYFGQDFGLASIGVDHLHLSSTLFAFYKLAQDVRGEEEGNTCLDSKKSSSVSLPMTTTLILPMIASTSGATSNPKITDQHASDTANSLLRRRKGLNWVRFADSFLCFHEIVVAPNNDASAAGVSVMKIKENKNLLLVLISQKNLRSEQVQNGCMEMLNTLESKLAEYHHLPSSTVASKGANFDWVAVFIDGELCRMYDIDKSSGTNSTFRSKTTKSAASIDRKFWRALQAESGTVRHDDDKMTSAGNKKQELISPSLTFMEVLSSIPMRLIQALSLKRNVKQG